MARHHAPGILAVVALLVPLLAVLRWLPQPGRLSEAREKLLGDGVSRVLHGAEKKEEAARAEYERAPRSWKAVYRLALALCRKREQQRALLWNVGYAVSFTGSGVDAGELGFLARRARELAGSP